MKLNGSGKRRRLPKTEIGKIKHANGWQPRRKKRGIEYKEGACEEKGTSIQEGLAKRRRRGNFPDHILVQSEGLVRFPAIEKAKTLTQKLEQRGKGNGKTKPRPTDYRSSSRGVRNEMDG